MHVELFSFELNPGMLSTTATDLNICVLSVRSVLSFCLLM